MRGVLVRVGVDLAFRNWNAPVAPITNEFVRSACLPRWRPGDAPLPRLQPSDLRSGDNGERGGKGTRRSPPATRWSSSLGFDRAGHASPADLRDHRVYRVLRGVRSPTSTGRGGRTRSHPTAQTAIHRCGRPCPPGVSGRLFSCIPMASGGAAPTGSKRICWRCGWRWFHSPQRGPARVAAPGPVHCLARAAATHIAANKPGAA